MARAIVVCLIAFIAYTKASESNVQSQTNPFAEKAIEIEKVANEAKLAFKGAVTKLNKVRVTGSNKIERINSFLENAVAILDDAPEKCRGDAKKHLMTLKSSGVGSFVTCSKLLEAAEDVGGVVMTTAGLEIDVIDIGRDVTMGFGGCLASLWPWNIIKCWWDRASTTYDDIKNLISDVTNYASRIEEYSHNATVLIEYCWNGQRPTVKADVLEIMTPVHQCANQPIPYDKYEL